MMSMGKSANHVERIASAIKRRIFKWEYPPNHPLVEELLGREFGVSRSPVREALRSLEAEGAVYRVNNRGFFVRQFKRGEVSDLYVVRLALELYTVEHLATHRETHGDVGALAGAWRKLLPDGSGKTPEELAGTDVFFHEHLTGLTGNGMLLAQLRHINARLSAFREMDFTLVMEQGNIAASCASHLEVIEAILKGDPNGAREALRANLAMGFANVDRIMGRILTKVFDS